MDRTSIKLIQYCEIDGVYNFPDSWIKSLFSRIREERLLSKAFYEGDVQTSDEFLQAMKHGTNRLFIIYRDQPKDPKDREILGITWLNGFRKRSAYMHQCLFRNAWGKESPEIGKAILDQLLHLSDSRGYVFDVLIGLTPANNRLAVTWLQKVGLNIIGEIPDAAWDNKLGKSIPALISYAQREEV